MVKIGKNYEYSLYVIFTLSKKKKKSGSKRALTPVRKTLSGENVDLQGCHWFFLMIES